MESVSSEFSARTDAGSSVAGSRLLGELFQRGPGLASRLRKVCYSLLGVRFSGPAWLRKIEISRGWPAISLGSGVMLDRGVTLLISGQADHVKLTLGCEVYVNRNTIIDVHEQVTIGDHTMIGANVYITDGNHGMAKGQLIGSQQMQVRPVTIGKDVWIAANAVILPGVRIGDGAVVAAGAVVNRSVSAMSIVAGVPAKPIGERS